MEPPGPRGTRGRRRAWRRQPGSARPGVCALLVSARSGLGRVAQRTDDVADPLVGLTVREPLELGDYGIGCPVVAGGLDQVGTRAREVGAVQPARELGPDHDRVGIDPYGGSADEGARRVAV